MDKEQRHRLDAELIRAAGGRDDVYVHQLLDAGADVNAVDESGWTPLHHASSAGRAEHVRIFIESNADINAGSNCGNTPLYLAARWGHIKCVRLLIEAGACIDIKNIDNETALDVLKEWHPGMYADHIGRLMAARPEAKRLVSEDKPQQCSTGFEYDM